MNPLAGKTWREAAQSLTWPEFRDALLDNNPLEIVNLPWWKEQYQKLRDE